MDKNHSLNSNPNSRDTSPTSRDDAVLSNDNTNNNTIINNNSSSTFDDPPHSSTYKVKFLCSYGGKIQPRPHDNHLSYVGGDTKILAVDRSIKFSAIMSKLSSLANNAALCFKYQLPGEDLDALISVTNDEDLDHMMAEYDRLSRSSPTKPARMRLILFPLNNTAAPPNNSSSPAPTYAPEPKSERQWFVDALNSVQIPHLERPPPPPPNPDFLFGFDKVYPKPPDSVASPTVPDFAAKDFECGPEERKAVIEEEPQIHEELQKVQISNNENHNQHQQHQQQLQHQQQQQQLQQQQLLLHQLKINEENGGVYGVNGADSYYVQKTAEKVTPLASNPHVQVHPGPVHPNPVHTSFITNGGYAEPGPVYLIQTASGIYQAVRPVTMTAAPVGPTYYALPKFVPPPSNPTPVAGSADVYNTAPLSHSQSASNIGGGGGYNGSASQVGLVNNENGYSQVGVQHAPERSVGWN